MAYHGREAMRAQHPLSTQQETLQKPNPTNSQSFKRKVDETQDIDSEDDCLCYVDKSCDQVRTQIRNFLNSGSMKVTEFQKAIHCSTKAYTRFMGQNGRDKGSGSDVYYAAFKFFKRRELQGIKVPKKRVRSADESMKNDVSRIRLGGEEDLSVPVYDSCDEIRKKIGAYLRKPGVTQAGFLREIAKAYPEGKKVYTKVLNDFLGKRGATSGNTSSVFYGSYVFFEKLRIIHKKPKSKHREQMEREYPGKGIDTKQRHDRVWCMKGDRPYEDKFGKIHIEGRF